MNTVFVLGRRGRTPSPVTGKVFGTTALPTRPSVAFTKRFSDKFGGPPENQAWGDYVAIGSCCRPWQEIKGTDTAKIIAYFEKGARLRHPERARGTFRPWDHQLLQEMYVVGVRRSKMKDKWDIFDVVMPVPGPNESLELIQPTKENPCTMGAPSGSSGDLRDGLG